MLWSWEAGWGDSYLWFLLSSWVQRRKKEEKASYLDGGGQICLKVLCAPLSKDNITPFGPLTLFRDCLS